MAFSCGQCGAAISAGQIDFSKKMASCGSCGTVGPLGGKVGSGPVARMPPEFDWEEEIVQGVATIQMRTPLARGYTLGLIAFGLAMVGGSGLASFGWSWFLVFLIGAVVMGGRAYRDTTASTLLRITASSVYALRRPTRESLELNSPPLVFRAEPAPAEVTFVSATGLNMAAGEAVNSIVDSSPLPQRAGHATIRTIPWWTVRVETADGSVRALPLRVDSAQLAEHAAARMNEVLAMLGPGEASGYRVAPRVSAAPLQEDASDQASRRRGA